jgi:hypothetical protein
MWVSWAPVSDEPTPSTTTIPGLASIRRCLVVGVSSAPPLATTASGVSPARSMADASGRAIASPTTVATITCSRSIVATISSASNRSTTDENTTV